MAKESKFGLTGYKLDDRCVGKLEEAFALGCTVKDACIYAGIHRDTYYVLIKERGDLSDRFEELRLNPILKARKTIVDDLGNPKTAQWFISRRRPKEFSAHSEEEVDDTYLDAAEWQKARLDDQLMKSLRNAWLDLPLPSRKPTRELYREKGGPVREPEEEQPGIPTLRIAVEEVVAVGDACLVY